MALSKAPLALKSGGVVSSNSYPCPRTLRAEEETRGLPLICLSAFRLATRREASGRRDGLVSRKLCSLHHQPRGRGRERAQDGAAAGGDGRVAGRLKSQAVAADVAADTVSALRPASGPASPSPQEWEGLVADAAP